MAQTASSQAIPLPGKVRDLLLLKVPDGELARWAVEAIVVEAVREHMISRNKAATFLGLEDYESREAFFERHGLLNSYTLEMIREDFETIDLLEAKRQRG